MITQPEHELQSVDFTPESQVVVFHKEHVWFKGRIRSWPDTGHQGKFLVSSFRPDWSANRWWGVSLRRAHELGRAIPLLLESQPEEEPKKTWIGPCEVRLRIEPAIVMDSDLVAWGRVLIRIRFKYRWLRGIEPLLNRVVQETMTLATYRSQRSLLHMYMQPDSSEHSSFQAWFEKHGEETGL